MTIMDRIRSKITPTAPIATADGIATETLVDNRPPAKLPKVRLPISEGELLPWKGLVFKITAVGEEEFTAKCMGLTHARARKLGIA